nr:bidirectional sugar transporter SWEET4-like [Ipomoea batatas]
MLSKDTARTVIGIIGNVTALVLFLSPLPTIVKIWKKKSVEQFSAAPYLATFLNCGMWVLYAIPSVHPNSFLLMTINGAGIAIYIVFLLVFLFFSDTKTRFRVALIVLAEVAFMAALAIMVLTLAHTWKLRSTIVGSIVVVCSILMYASPLAVMVRNFTALVLFLSPLPTIVKIWKKKSVEQFSAAPYLATFLNCGMWMLYAIPSVHPNSFFLMTINGAGITIDIVFLLVFLFFSDTKKRIRVALIVLAEVVFIAALAIMVLTLAHTWKLRSAIVGSIVVVCSMLMYASPLAIMVPNGMGALSGLVQLVLYAIYYKSNKIVEEKQVDMEVGFTKIGLSSNEATESMNLQNFDAIIKHSELHSRKKSLAESMNLQNFENHTLYSTHQILETWICVLKSTLNRVAERIESNPSEMSQAIAGTGENLESVN